MPRLVDGVAHPGRDEDRIVLAGLELDGALAADVDHHSFIAREDELAPGPEIISQGIRGTWFHSNGYLSDKSGRPISTISIVCSP